MIENKTAEVYKWLKTVSEQIYISEKERENKIHKRIKEFIFINLILLIYALTQKNELASRIFVICGIALFCIYSLYRTTSFPDIADFYKLVINESENFLEEEQRDKYYILTISEIQESLGKSNENKAIAFNMTCICEILGLISLMLGL